MIGAVESDLRFSVTPEGNPARAEWVIGARGDRVFCNGVLPSGVLALAHDVEPANGRLPVILSNGDFVEDRVFVWNA